METYKPRNNQILETSEDINSSESDPDDDIDEEEAIADRLLERLDKGKSILDKCGERILQIQFQGKSLKEWQDELTVFHPDLENCSDAQIVFLLSKFATELSQALQTANYLLGTLKLYSKSTTSLYEREYSVRYSEEIKKIGTRRISAEKINQQTLLFPLVDKSLTAVQSVVALEEFFKRIISGLEESRKCLEVQSHLAYLRSK